MTLQGFPVRDHLIASYTETSANRTPQWKSPYLDMPAAKIEPKFRHGVWPRPCEMLFKKQPWRIYPPKDMPLSWR
jgi:hypothetical protein